ncbi:cytochrome P450 [Streptomyces sp. NPDC051172]|uniref:cytochrome P450 n=1 Tax=Streptomyces sp. NPDC051172 TaxID=3155796 RepID=UPI003443F393
MPEPLPSTMAELTDWARHRRGADPVYYDERQEAWQIFRYADIAAILKDPPRYLADLGNLVASTPELELVQRGNFVNMDGPRHRLMRGRVAQAFHPRAVAAMEPRLEVMVRDLLDGLAGRDAFDLVGELAYPLPVMVIAELIGIPGGDRELFRGWAEEFFPFDEEEPQLTSSQEAVDTLTPTVKEMTAYLFEHIHRRRRGTYDDLTARLVEAADAQGGEDGERLTDEDLVGMIALLLTAGHITTAALLGSCVLQLDRHPRAAAEVRAAPELLPLAIEEVLRFHPPLPRLTRRTATEVTVGGRTVPEGQILALWLVSANRDEAEFADPDRFDVRRRPNPHLSFGHGIHFCLGAGLARLETRIALRQLFERYGRIEVAGEGRFHHPFAILSAKNLPVRVTPV